MILPISLRTYGDAVTRRRLKGLFSSILELVGLAGISIGLGLIWLPLGFVAAGVALVLIGISI